MDYYTVESHIALRFFAEKPICKVRERQTVILRQRRYINIIAADDSCCQIRLVCVEVVMIVDLNALHTYWRVNRVDFSLLRAVRLAAPLSYG